MSHEKSSAPALVALKYAEKHFFFWSFKYYHYYSIFKLCSFSNAQKCLPFKG